MREQMQPPALPAAFGTNSKGTPGEKYWAEDLKTAKALMYTCVQMYQRMATGIAPEYVEFNGPNDLHAPSRVRRPSWCTLYDLMHYCGF